MKLVVHGIVTNYVSEGKGPVALLLHGWGSSLNVYDGLSRRLSQDYQVVRFDWPGFGDSELPPATWGIKQFADFAMVFCKKLKIEPEVIVGHSMGGQTAVHLVGEGQLAPKRLILLAASAIRPAPGARESLYKAVAKTGKTLVRNQRLAGRLKRRLYEQTGTVDYLNSGPMQASYRLVVTQDQRVLARRITIPTLLVWGDRDDAAPLDRGQLLSECIAGSKLEILPDTGHYMFLDEPERSAELIKDFLDPRAKG